MFQIFSYNHTCIYIVHCKYHTPSMCVYIHVYHVKVLFVHSSFLTLHLDCIYSCKVSTTKGQIMTDGGGAAVGEATGTSSQKFFAGHSGCLRADSV